MKYSYSFVDAVDHALDIICNNPSGWRNVYKDYYELGLKKYPYSIVYNINEDKKSIIIKAVYHQSRSPKR